MFIWMHIGLKTKLETGRMKFLKSLLSSTV